MAQRPAEVPGSGLRGTVAVCFSPPWFWVEPRLRQYDGCPKILYLKHPSYFVSLESQDTESDISKLKLRKKFGGSDSMAITFLYYVFTNKI